MNSERDDDLIRRGEYVSAAEFSPEERLYEHDFVTWLIVAFTG